MTKTMLRELESDEQVVFTKIYPAQYTSYDHVILGPQILCFMWSVPTLQPPYEKVMIVPRDTCIWIVDTICALLVPQSMGGVSDDVFAVNLERSDAPLRLRRSAQIGGPGEQGFTLFHRGMPHRVGFLSTAWSDRVLFDEGLFPVLVRIASEWAKVHGQSGPRPEAETIRPNWMGRSPAETPPPASE